MKVIYDKEDGTILSASLDPREKEGIETSLSVEDIFKHKFDLKTKKLVLISIEYTPKTDISVQTTRGLINTTYSYPFTTELPNDNYFMPVRQQGTEVKKLFNIVVLDGKGILNVNFKESGIYYIDEDDLSTSITVNGVDDSRFTLYIAE